MLKKISQTVRRDPWRYRIIVAIIILILALYFIHEHLEHLAAYSVFIFIILMVVVEVYINAGPREADENSIDDKGKTQKKTDD